MALLNIPVSYWRRHLGLVVRYGTLKKYWNAVRALHHYTRGSRKIPSKPCFLKVEISRFCTVQCKSCPAGKDTAFFDYDDYTELIDRYKDVIFEVSLYDIGEPLHNTRALEYIRYAHEAHIGTSISTSLSLKKPDAYWEALVTSGLDHMIVALDGITEEVYQQYRTNGNLQLALTNLRCIHHYRKRHNSPLAVEWQMIDFPWNRHEQSAAKQMAAELGCDFHIISDVSSRTTYETAVVKRTKNCLLPFVILIIDAYQRVHPCYKMYNEHMTLGSLLESSTEEIWNGDAIGCIRNHKLIRNRHTCKSCRE